MKKNIILLALLLGSVYSLSAQTSRSVYFSEKNPLRHEFNASFAPESGYVSIPMLGNLSLSTSSNIKVSSFLYPQADGDGLNTFMSPDVSSSEFLSNINSDNILNFNFSFDILNGGFYKWGGFNNIALSTTVSSSINIPEGVFQFLKLGMANETNNYYQFNDMYVSASAVTELALGHSREMLLPGLRLGAKVKFLFGIVNVDAQFNNFSASLSQEKWMITNDGTLNMSGITPSYDSEGGLDGIDSFSPGLNGFGIAVDLGASYAIMDNFNVSLAVNDLGFMQWKNISSSEAKETFEFTGFEDIDILGDVDESIDSQVDDLQDDLQALFSYVESKTGATKSTNCLATTINAGADYGILDSKISFGLLATAEFNSNYTWADLMGSVNFRPASCVNLGINGSVSTFGTSFGAMIDLCHKNFNMFVAANAMSLSVASGVPVPLNGLSYQFNLGFSVMLAKNR